MTHHYQQLALGLTGLCLSTDLAKVFGAVDSVMIDYYTPKMSGARQIEITPDKFGGNYYLEASTLFRDTNGVDMPAEFVIPNCKIQSNFTFSMASTGDPSTFTFTMDAFPGYTYFNPTKKVLCAMQIIDDAEEAVKPDGESVFPHKSGEKIEEVKEDSVAETALG